MQTAERWGRHVREGEKRDVKMKRSEADGEGLGEKRKKCARVKKERFQEQLM